MPTKRNKTIRHKRRKSAPDPLADFSDLTDHQRKFLTAYANCGNITGAAELAKMTRQCHYRWLRELAPSYAEAFDSVREMAIESLEAEARRRAMTGSDVLLIFLLKAHRPEKYRDNHRVELKADPPSPPMSDEEIIGRIRQFVELAKARHAQKLAAAKASEALSMNRDGQPTPCEASVPPPDTVTEATAPDPIRSEPALVTPDPAPRRVELQYVARPRPRCESVFDVPERLWRKC